MQRSMKNSSPFTSTSKQRRFSLSSFASLLWILWASVPPVDRLGLQGNRAQVALLQQRRAQVLKRRVRGSRRACTLICS